VDAGGAAESAAPPVAAVEERLPRLALALALALCVLCAWAKFSVNAPRRAVGHGDVAYYTTLAKNLATGRGFEIDYVPSYLNDPPGIPQPANSYWMPLSSVLCAGPMALFGADYRVAQATMIVFTSLAPLIALLIGAHVFASWRAGLLGALLAATFHGFLNSASVPQSHGPVLIVGGACLYFAARSMRDARWLKLAAACAALAHQNRSDGVCYWAAILAAFALRPERLPWRALLAPAAVYAACMAPLVLSNLWSFGRPLPPGLGKAALMTVYPQLYSLPESLTWDSFQAAWPDAVLAARQKALATNAQSLVFAMAVGGKMPGGLAPNAELTCLTVLSWIGAIFLARRRAIGVWALLAALAVLYTLIFAVTGLASFRAALYSIVLFWLVASAAALEWLLAWPARLLGRRGTWVGFALALAACGWIARGSLGYARQLVANGSVYIDEELAFQEQFRAEVIEPFGLDDEVVMCFGETIHEFHALTGLRLVSLPYGEEPEIRATCERFGARYVLLWAPETTMPIHPGLKELARSKRYELLLDTNMLRREIRLWRLRDAAEPRPGREDPTRRRDG
jgi:hypothetical protein